MRTTDISSIVAGLAGALLVTMKDVLEAINHFAPAIGAIVTVLALFANIYFQVDRRKKEEKK